MLSCKIKIMFRSNLFPVPSNLFEQIRLNITFAQEFAHVWFIIIPDGNACIRYRV